MEELETVAPGVLRLAVRTPTLPPATHTNCYLAGDAALTVFDPASPWDDEQARLAAALDALGRPVRRIVLTHHHPDHVGGALALQAHLASRGEHAPIVAHPVTADLLAAHLPVDERLDGGAELDCDGVRFRAVFTPGHAPGHLVFHDEDHGTIVAGDMVAGVGTILIDPVEGDLGDYLDSLARMKDLGPSVLLPSHGPALDHAEAVLGFYVAHRHMRTEQIREALTSRGQAAPDDLVTTVYPELPAQAHPVAAIQILAHLKWLVGQGAARSLGGGTYGAA